ncbi:zinc ribbon domain-containing protein [Sphingobacterium sp. WM]|uniref:zinc ribbon domain-containing protein n=1 Tax=Sphingobacterium sp. WM TaxID=3031802 RepID=UPI00240DE6E3|nr:zinc ribbon domain-containing protein [Sphingobacterium sp. WM]WFB61990.1 zinc ribbon domain-containing protein [Sphingobacterium sp. WM]
MEKGNLTRSCIQCGQSNPIEFNFCSNCGAKNSKDEPTVNPSNSNPPNSIGKAGVFIAGALTGSAFNELSHSSSEPPSTVAISTESILNNSNQANPNATLIDYDGNNITDGILVDNDNNNISEAIFLDSDQNGLVDAIMLDSDQDGLLDAMILDSDGDGIMDAIILDSNKDGLFDSISMDTNQDGLVDAIILDSDTDGVVDAMLLDVNYDGVVDEVFLTDQKGVNLDDVGSDLENNVDDDFDFTSWFDL